MLSRDEFLKPRRPPFEVVEIPELGGSVVVQGMTVSMRDRFLKKLAADRETDLSIGYTTLLLLWSLADDNGQPLFKIEDAALLGNLPSSITEALVIAAESVSGLTVKIPAKPESTPKN